MNLTGPGLGSHKSAAGDPVVPDLGEGGNISVLRRFPDAGYGRDRRDHGRAGRREGGNGGAINQLARQAGGAPGGRSSEGGRSHQDPPSDLTPVRGRLLLTRYSSRSIRIP